MNDLKRCDYCELMFKHIVILRNKLMEPQLQSSDRDATILELKSYYWLTRTYYQKFLKQCNCEYKNKFEQTLKYLLEVFKENDVKLDSDKAKCDICKILPCELFPLLDKACTIYVQHDLELMCVELQYHIFLSFIFQEMIEQCTLCDEFVDYKACIEAACTYLFNKDIYQLQEFVYFWKRATNDDEILSCVDSLNLGKEIRSFEVKIDNHVTVYLDFNVYNLYEKEPKITDFFNKLSNKEEIDLIYSGTHLEEVLRMNNNEYEEKRVQSIQTLTHGKMAVVDAKGKIVICVENAEERMKQVEQYQQINFYAEQGECIEAEAREHLLLHEKNEQRDKAIGVSSLEEIMDNVKDDSGKIKKPYLPDKNELNNILKYVGIGNESIEDYKDKFKLDEGEFYQVRTAIVSIARLLNVLGLHGDKITKKNDVNARYPIYDKKSYRTIRSEYYDNDHLSFASKCTYFITTDATLCSKAREIYGLLGIKTIPILLNEFIDM